jgi:hypothetical protein
MGPILSALDDQFTLIDRRSRELLSLIDDDRLFEDPRDAASSTSVSCGECMIRSAAMVERTFGGITTRLWDDPFEWTLSEKLGNKAAILEYLDEVEATRKKGFALFSADADLGRTIPAPENLTPLLDILLRTLCLASHYQGRAFAIFQMMTDNRPPRL